MSIEKGKIMKIAIEQFEKLGACAGGIEWLRGQKSLDLVDLVEAAIQEKEFRTSKGETENTLDYAGWAIVRLMDNQEKARYSIFSARQVIHIFEDKHPKDLRPREAIEAAEEYLKEPTESNKKKAKAAAAAAYSAGHAAASAATVAAIFDTSAYSAYSAAAAAYYAYAVDVSAVSYAYADDAYAAAAAAYATDAAACAIAAAASAADTAATKHRMMDKILRHGVKILLEP